MSMKKLLVVFVAAGTMSLPVASQTSPVDLSNAEVIVTSSTNPSFVGMTNTDAQGRFVLNGVPAGGINVVIRRNNQIVAQGAAVFVGGNLNEAQVLNIAVAPVSNTLKSTPSQ